MERHKRHRKRHILPGPAGLVMTTTNTNSSCDTTNTNTNDNNNENSNDDDDDHDEEENPIMAAKRRQALNWTQPQSLVTRNSNGAISTSNYNRVIHQPAWRAMCVCLDRYIPPTNHINHNTKHTNIRNYLPSNFALLSDVLASSHETKGCFVVAMITSVQCNMHCDWTCELVDDGEDGTSSSSSDKKAIGWLEESFIRRVKPEVIARPGVVLLLQNLVTTAFLQSQEDDDDYYDEDVFSITEQQQQTQKQKVEQMILIGDKTVIHMWLPEESSVAITNEQFQQCQQLQLQRNRSNIHKETTDPNNSSIEEEDHEFNNPQLVASPKQNNHHHPHVPIITNVDNTVPPQRTTNKSLTDESSIPNNNLWSTNDFSLSLCSSMDTSIIPPVDSAELHTITTNLPLNNSNVSPITHPQQQQQQQECITTQSNSNNTLFVDVVAQQSNEDDLALFHATDFLDDLSD